MVLVACHRANSSSPNVIRSSSGKSTTGHLRAKQAISRRWAAVRIATSPPKLEPTSPIRSVASGRHRSNAAVACCYCEGGREIFERALAASLAERSRSRKWRCRDSLRRRVKVLLVVLFLPERNPWHSTARPCRRPVGRAQDCGNAVTMPIMKREGFFHGMTFQSRRL